MKHTNEVDELFRLIDLYEKYEAYQEYLAILSRIIEPGVQRDIKSGTPVTYKSKLDT